MDLLEGRIYLFLGAPTGWKRDTNCSEANLTIMSDDPYDEFGYSVAFAGDINNDGSDDIIVGAPLNDDETEDAGKVYLFVGNNYIVNPSENGGLNLIPGYNFYLILGILGFSSIIILIFSKKKRK
jgi:hypothetical protein